MLALKRHQATQSSRINFRIFYQPLVVPQDTQRHAGHDCPQPEERGPCSIENLGDEESPNLHVAENTSRRKALQQYHPRMIQTAPVLAGAYFLLKCLCL